MKMQDGNEYHSKNVLLRHPVPEGSLLQAVPGQQSENQCTEPDCYGTLTAAVTGAKSGLPGYAAGFLKQRMFF